MRPAITTLALTRSWLFVPYGERAPTAPGRPTITCDGRVAGATLELTHWTDNATPDALYADTSTECALNLARARLERSEYADYDDALVINNHFDTDGVLSIWACLQPSEALDCAPLLASGAAAGDFGEWQTDAGVKLDLAIGAMSAETDDDADAYDLCLDRLPWLLDDLASGGRASRSLWEPGWRAVEASYEDIAAGRVKISRDLDGDLGDLALCESEGAVHVNHYALSRAISDLRDGAAPVRWLRVRASGTGAACRYRYAYELPGHGWVKRLVTRRAVPPADGTALAAALSAALGAGEWAAGGSAGLTAVCHSVGAITATPAEVVDALRRSDAAALARR